MLNNQNLETIKKTIQEFFQKTSFEVDVEILRPENETIPVRIKTEEPKILIGQNGQTLAEIQRLLKAILKHKVADHFYLDIDINNYREKKNEYLKETARFLADDVALTKKEKILMPMSSYERRIIHLELANRKDIATQSIGEGLERKIVIKPSL